MIKPLIIEKNKKKLSNRTIEYYENNKGRLREQAKNKYRELSNEQKIIKREYGKNEYQNMSEENLKNIK